MNIVFEKILTWLSDPVLFKMMGGRVQRLQFGLEGLARTGIPLVGWNGTSYVPAEKADDIGTYLIVPLLSRSLGLSLDGALILFFGSMIAAGIALGVWGIVLLYDDARSRAHGGAAVMVIGFLSFLFWDLYVPLGVATIAVVPMTLALMARRPNGGALMVWAGAAGVVASAANLTRSHAGTPVALFFLLLAVSYVRTAPLRRGAIVLVFASGWIIPSLAASSVLSRRDAFLKDHPSDFAEMMQRHTFWHPVYLGLGFLKNDLGIAYEDQIAVRRVKELSPNTIRFSPEYELVLRGETMRIVKEQPGFVAKTLAAKGALIAGFLLLFANIGWVAAARRPKPWPIEAAFLLACGFHAMIGFLVIPHPKYLLGLFAFAALYGAVSCGHIRDPRTLGGTGA